MNELREKLAELTDEQFAELMQNVKGVADNIVASKIAEKENLLKEIQALKDRIEQLKKEYSQTEDWKSQKTNSEERYEIDGVKIPALENKLHNADNYLRAVTNGGTVVSFKDALGNKVREIPDFREIKTDLISFDQDTILVDEVPAYIPIINERSFKNRGCIFDAIRMTTNTYILSPFVYNFGKENQFILVTLDQLVLINLYYITKLKAVNQKEADRRTQRNVDYYYTLSEEKRKGHFAQKGYYNSLPAKVKKEVSEEIWETLSLEEKEKLYIPIKRFNAEKIKSKLEEGYMWSSFHDMYNQFVNAEALKYTLNKATNERTYLPLGTSKIGNYANREVSIYWDAFKDMMQYKLKDIKFQREEQSENYKTAIETSFGDSNTKDTLLAEYGVMVKRQNGDEINFTETEQIRESLEAVQSVFGNLKDKFIEAKMKISHTGNKLVFARKAIGVYIGSMGTIASSNKYGNIIFDTTIAHEIAHFIDNYLGIKNGKRWATDDYESLAGKIAFNFRNNMNKPKSEQTEYINATKECFARALEQYFAVSKYGEDVEIVYSDSPASVPEKVFTQNAYVGKRAYYDVMKPLIDNFFEENKDFFKLTINLDADSPAIIAETQLEIKNNDVKEAIEALELLLEVSEEQEKEEIKDAIEVLKMLL
jgi:hypothetical protein